MKKIRGIPQSGNVGEIQDMNWEAENVHLMKKIGKSKFIKPPKQ